MNEELPSVASRPLTGELDRWVRPGALSPLAEDEVALPLPRPMRPVDWARRLLIWAMLIAGVGVLFRFDLTLMSWRYRLFDGEPDGTVKRFLGGFREFGQIVPMLVAVVIVWRSDRRRVLFLLALIFSQAVGAMIYHPIKWAVPRYRPSTLVEEVARPRFAPSSVAAGAADAATNQDKAKWLGRLSASDTWGEPAGSSSAAHESFPSGHSAAAFAFATVLAWFYPHLRRLFWILAAGCALSRYLDAVHWPSDCLGGALLGYALGWVALRPYVWGLPLKWFRGRRAEAARS